MTKYFGNDKTVIDLHESVTASLTPENSTPSIHSLSQPPSTSTAHSNLYADYYSEDSVLAGIKSGIYIRGTLQVSETQTEESFLVGETGSRDILIASRIDRNRGIHGDMVAVELFSENSWSAPSELLSVENSESGADLKIAPSGNKNWKKKLPTGKVVGILQRNWR